MTLTVQCYGPEYHFVCDVMRVESQWDAVFSKDLDFFDCGNGVDQII